MSRFSALTPFLPAVFLSAFLLFQIQPLVGKHILPWYGGTAAVWTTCLLFFQALLCAGYTYAHVSVSLLSTRFQLLVHGALLVVAAFVFALRNTAGKNGVSAENRLTACCGLVGTT